LAPLALCRQVSMLSQNRHRRHSP